VYHFLDDILWGLKLDKITLSKYNHAMHYLILKFKVTSVIGAGAVRDQKTSKFFVPHGRTRCKWSY
jgi:hypothetical protein